MKEPGTNWSKLIPSVIGQIHMTDYINRTQLRKNESETDATK